MEQVKKQNIFKNELFTSSLVYFVSTLLFVVIDILSAFKCFDFMGKYSSNVVNGFIQVGIMFFIPLMLYKLISKKKFKSIFEDFHYQPVSAKTVGYSFLIGFVVYFGVVIISVLSSNFFSLFGYKSPFSGGGQTKTSFWMMLLSVLLSAVFPAICEEFLNRGMMLNATKKLGAKKAVIFSALLFALMHFNINQVVYAFIIGLLLGSITLMTKSIIPAMIIHFTNNFSDIIYGYLGQFGKVGQFMNNFINGIFVGNGFLVILKCIMISVIVISVIAFCTGKIFLAEKNKKIKSKFMGAAKNENSGNTVIIRNASGETVSTYQTVDITEAKAETEKEFKPQDLFNVSRKKKELWDYMIGDSIISIDDTKPIHKTFLYASIVLAGLMTLFTLIWGLM